MSRVREFHNAFGLDAPPAPTAPSLELAALRMRLISEEYYEVQEEASKLLRALRFGASLVEIVPIMQDFIKEISDLRYVAEGALVSFGVEPTAYDEVHRSNMSKLGEDGKPVHREDGKVLKGPGYTPANPERMFPSVIEGTCQEV